MTSGNSNLDQVAGVIWPHSSSVIQNQHGGVIPQHNVQVFDMPLSAVPLQPPNIQLNLRQKKGGLCRLFAPLRAHRKDCSNLSCDRIAQAHAIWLFQQPALHWAVSLSAALRSIRAITVPTYLPTYLPTYFYPLPLSPSLLLPLQI